ncbi:MAG TPA: GAF domain-containing protein [Candidatus Marinimicrobia bacterium]|nr:GAF domain-containing protein [Candidatus Neomarinimicrobiota bacterium]
MQEGLEFIQQIVNCCCSREAKLLEICRFLNYKFTGFDWVGFYFSDNPKKELVLGPFVGAPTEHKNIPFGRGVCGSAAISGITVNVADVTAESNYLACGLEVRSEIVIPIFKSGKFVGELDIDSHQPGRFGSSERRFLEQVGQIISIIF